MHGTDAPSPWITRYAHLVTPQGSVLDLACGYGRHTRFFAARGCAVTAVDRDYAALEALADAQCERIQADIENAAWPLEGRMFDAVIVTNYLWRALLPAIVQSVGPGGVLLYETFARGNETVGKPANPDFLLMPGELLSAVQGPSVQGQLRVVAYEDGFTDSPPRYVQRIAAVRESAAAIAPRYRLV
jgi:SAM-dependent methyltransferase